MKREIKFRVWDKEDKRMITHEQDFIPLKVTSIGLLRLNPHHVESFWEIMPIERFELMQFTGVKDSNGVGIYEGDLFEDLGSDFDYLLCEWNSTHGHFEINGYFKDHEGEQRIEEHALLLANTEDLTVIGNIHTNPDLLTN